MKIIHATVGLYPERGGPPVVIANLAAEQARLGHDVCVVSLPPHSGDVSQLREMLDSVPGGSAVELHVPSQRHQMGWLVGRPDVGILPDGNWEVVHIHELWNPFDYAVSRAAVARQIPYVVTMHGLLSPHRLADRAFKKRVARALWVDRMLRQAWFVHGLTDFECSSVAALLPNLPLVQIANGYSSLLGVNNSHALDGIRASLQGRRFILFMGRLHIMKGTDVLIPAFAALALDFPDVDLVIAGSDYGQQGAMESSAAQYDLGHRVHFVGLTVGATKCWLLQEAAAFLLPSRDEGFSVAILEAMSMGAPVIMTPECHFPEAALAGAAIEVNRHPQAVSNALRSILSDNELRTRLSTTGRNFVTETYTWPAIAQRMVCAYKAGGECWA